MYHTPDAIDQPLHIIVPIFNPLRFKSRWKLFQRFVKVAEDAGGIVHTVEAAFGERSPAVSTRAPQGEAADHSRHNGSEHTYTLVRTNHEFWVKEQLINLGFQRISQLYPNWKYGAWIDADVTFTRPNWVGETVHQLQHYKFLQLFSHAVDLCPKYTPLQSQRVSFLEAYMKGMRVNASYYKDSSCYYGSGKAAFPGATGLAWAATREALDDVGGLMDFCILGSADWHQVHCLVGKGQYSAPKGLSRDYKDKIMLWQERAEKHIRRKVGVVSGLLAHHFHGRKADRKYKERWAPLVEFQYQPSIDIKPDTQGLYQLVDHGDDRSLGLRDAIMRYLRERNEDSIDIG